MLSDDKPTTTTSAAASLFPITAEVPTVAVISDGDGEISWTEFVVLVIVLDSVVALKNCNGPGEALMKCRRCRRPSSEEDKVFELFVVDTDVLNAVVAAVVVVVVIFSIVAVLVVVTGTIGFFTTVNFVLGVVVDLDAAADAVAVVVGGGAPSVVAVATAAPTTPPFTTFTVVIVILLAVLLLEEVVDDDGGAWTATGCADQANVRPAVAARLVSGTGNIGFEDSNLDVDGMIDWLYGCSFSLYVDTMSILFWVFNVIVLVPPLWLMMADDVFLNAFVEFGLSRLTDYCCFKATPQCLFFDSVLGVWQAFVLDHAFGAAFMLWILQLAPKIQNPIPIQSGTDAEWMTDVTIGNERLWNNIFTTHCQHMVSCLLLQEIYWSRVVHYHHACSAANFTILSETLISLQD
jgi:hypothetical protein